ncbi:MAG: hypothetical protein ABSG73_04145 [Candidatus Aminicenantales bacterium]|jgi:hypothetical protein
MPEGSIKALERRVTRLEDAVYGKKVTPILKTRRESYSGATGGVRFLISKDFFSEKRKLGEVWDALTKNGYHWSRQAVDMALKGLASRRGPLTLLKEGGRNVFVKRK